MLELYAKRQNMTTGSMLKANRLLGSIIPIIIPRTFISWGEIALPQEINSQDNPVKIKEGQFFFGKNGVTAGRTGWMLNLLFQKYPYYSEICCPRILKTCDLTRFIASDYTFAMTSWFKHSRFIIKINKESIINESQADETVESVDESVDETIESVKSVDETVESVDANESEKTDTEVKEDDSDDADDADEFDDSSSFLTDSTLDSEKIELAKKNMSKYEIWIVDPWMRKLPYDLSNKLSEKNSPELVIKLLNRTIKDQNKEGSCVLCSLARLIYLMSSIYQESKDPIIPSGSNLELEFIKNLNTPLPDFYAYLAKYLYRKTTI